MKSVCDSSGYQYIGDINDACNFFPVTVEEIIKLSTDVQKITPEKLQKYLSQDSTKITKKEALYVLDAFWGYYDSVVTRFELISMVHPDASVREAAQEEREKLQKISIDLFDMNRDLYLFLRKYAQEGEDVALLTDAEQYHIKELLASYERNGLNLPAKEFDKVVECQKELTEIQSQFESAIAQDTRTIEVSKSELAGVPDDFIAALSITDDGRYILKMDYPTNDMMMRECSIAETRRKYFEAFNNRAYPANEKTLQLLISKRHTLAQLLGFKNFAEYDLSDQMAGTPEVAWKLHKDLLPFILKKEKAEKEAIFKDLPADVVLHPDGTMNFWDWLYSTNYYTKKYYNFDDAVLQEYFPLDSTIQGLFRIYEQFFGITLRIKEVTRKWHDDLFVVEILKENKILGYVFVDLHPRDNKFSHAAVFPGKYTHVLQDGTIYPGVCTLVCNFTKPTETKPALLTFDEVSTFFHEFGHALHCILSTTHLMLQAGAQVKCDFVELPSQILELWLEDKAILKSLGKHYKTGEPIPDELIDKKLELLTVSNGYFEARQALFGMISLKLFEKQDHEDMDQVYYDYLKELSPFINQDEKFHILCNFGHLTSYAAKYYGYLWTRILAADAFEQIKQEGLLNPVAGKRYCDAILSRGGSKDPNDLLCEYLGRKPSQDAFLKRNKFE